MSTSKRLSSLLATANVIPFDEASRIVIMSDCHRGDGSWGDNFSNNQNLFFAALTHYYEKGYTYIELGDGDELWENRKFEKIIAAHSDAFWLMAQFYKEGRFHMLYGNHDIMKKNFNYTKQKCDSYYCESKNSQMNLFPGIEITEALILQDTNTKHKILLAHGHQGEFLNDTIWQIARFLVRYLWRPLELLGIHDPTSAAKNNDKQNSVEKKLIAWSEKENQMLIAGHTHHPVFPKEGEPLYFNDGSCVHPRCITAIEIKNNTISLVKWTIKTKADQTLFVGREILEPPINLSDYFLNIHH